MRIVSLLPSTTEIIFELGLAEKLVGVTFECNFPTQAQHDREIVVSGLDTHDLTPKQIDDLVRERMSAGGGLYALDEAALARCDPDLILTQDLCRVCAVPSGDVDEALSRLNCHATVLQIDPQDLGSVIQSIQSIADATGTSEQGEIIVSALTARLDSLKQRINAHLGDRIRPKVFVLEWVDPPYLAGHWVPDLVTAAGGDPVLCRPGQRSVATTWQEISDSNPDYLIVAPCGFDLAGAEKQALVIAEKILPTCSIWVIDADAVVVRPGPRLVDGVEAIASALFGFEIAGFTQFPDHLIRRIR